jgi:Tat protein secretion system quality control protein TatD with DNase activity
VPPLYDAHNHLQDARLAVQLEGVLAECRNAGIARLVVNGSREADWPRVRALAKQHPIVLPSFGYHPWYVGGRTDRWLDELQRHLDAVPSAVGEVGLDRWMENPDVPLQEELFRAQLRVAAARNLPVSIHCLRAWGRLVSSSWARTSACPVTSPTSGRRSNARHSNKCRSTGCSWRPTPPTWGHRMSGMIIRSPTRPPAGR